MPYGNFYKGQNRFALKKRSGNRFPLLNFTNNQTKNVFNRYISGSGVGASSYAIRRYKNTRATFCTDGCRKDFYFLGFPLGGGGITLLNSEQINKDEELLKERLKQDEERLKQDEAKNKYDSVDEFPTYEDFGFWSF